MSKFIQTGIIPRLNQQEGDFQYKVTIFERSGQINIEGYPEYSGYTSTPPKYYKKEVYEGRLASSIESPEWEMWGHQYSGEKVWPAEEGGSWVSFVGFYLSHDLPGPDDPRWVGQALGEPPMEDYIFYSSRPVIVDPFTFPNNSSILEVEGKTTTETYSSTIVRIDGRSEILGQENGVEVVTHGYLERRLEEEVDPKDILPITLENEPLNLEEIWTPGDIMKYAQTTLDWIDEGSWLGRQHIWEIEIEGLLEGSLYRITWLDNDTEHVEEFVADGFTKTFTQIVQPNHTHSDWGVEEI